MRKILVIGGETGSVTAPALAAHGHRVALADPWASPDNTPDGIECVIAADLSDRSAVFDMFDDAAAALGGLDTLVFTAANDAALRSGDNQVRVDPSPHAWRETVYRVLYGGVYSTQAALRRMVPQGSGRIFYLCSDQAIAGNVADPAVAAANCGLLALSSSLATSSFLQGVTLNALTLGSPYEPTDELPPIPEESDVDELPYLRKASDAVRRQRILHRLYENDGVDWAKSVVGMLSHLCSDEAALIAGSTLRLSNIGRDRPLVRWSC